MKHENLKLENTPEALRGVIENEIPAEQREAISTSIECGTVEDIRVTVSSEDFEILKKHVGELNSPSIEAKIAAGEAKLPVEKIELMGNDHARSIKITTKEAGEIKIPYDPEKMNRCLGGGAANTTTDVALINKSLYNSLEIDEDQIPKTGLYLTLPKTKQDELRKQCQNWQNLELNFIDGTPRRSISIKKEGSDEEFFFSTPLGIIDDKSSIPEREQTPRHIILHNQPDPRSIWAVKEVLDQNSEEVHLTWSLGSNQIADGIDRYGNHLNHCKAFTCNLSEAITWIRSSSDPIISEDEVLIKALEETDEAPKNPAHLEKLTTLMLNLSLKAKLAIHAFLEEDEKTIKFSKLKKRLLEEDNDVISPAEKEQLEKVTQNYKLPKDPEKRKIAAQRATQILSSLMNKTNSVFITDGEHPTTIRRTRESSNKKKIKTCEHYIPIIKPEKKQSIDDLIKAKGELPEEKDGTGCGDCFTGTVIALRQAAAKNIDVTTIAHIANHFTYLVYSLPYSNLLEIESAHPGIIDEVMKVALENIDEEQEKLHENSQLKRLRLPKTNSAIARVLGV